jgi:hypothetical protein
MGDQADGNGAILESSGPVGDDRRLERRYQEQLLEEEGDKYETACRWLEEVTRNHWKPYTDEASEL